MKYIVPALLFSLLMGCTHGSGFFKKNKSDNVKLKNSKSNLHRVSKNNSSREDDTLFRKRLIEKLEKDKTALELQNAILLRALKDRKKVVKEHPQGAVIEQFPQFEELIFDQAKTAYSEKDEERLQEAVRIMRTNRPHAESLETMFFWLAQLQEEKNQNSQALVTYNEFIKIFPNSKYVPQALYLKGKLYERLNLKVQAMKIYSDLRKEYPHSRESHLAQAELTEKNGPQEISKNAKKKIEQRNKSKGNETRRK